LAQTAPTIAIDGFNLGLEQGTGVATYARNLSFALHGLGAEVGVLYGRPFPQGKDALLREVNFFDPQGRRGGPWRRGFDDVMRAVRALGGESAFEVSLSGRVIAQDFAGQMPYLDKLWNSQGLFTFAADYFDAFGRALRIRLPQTPQVMHWTYPLPIEVVGAKNIYTLHDLVPLRLPHTTLDRKRRYLKLLRLLARRADHIVTVSEASKRDIQELLGVPESRLTNTYQSVQAPTHIERRTDDDIRAEVEGVFGLKHKGYFLFFGAIEPKKNVGRLLQAFLTAQVSGPLVLAGKMAWKAEQELRLLELGEARRRDGLQGRRVIHIDYLPADLLMTLVRGARAVVFPSLYEGFGLPVVEAMQLGTPVITSNTASLPEVAGDAALLVDPYDPSALIEALRRLDGDAALREDLAARGRIQAGLFSQAAYQSRLGDLYGRLGVSDLVG
jgi:glycosyltransferase involved in cell wall biosynthesis